MTTWTEGDSQALTVALVAHDGYRMPLEGEERAAAIRAMIARGVDVDSMAHRLCLTVTVFNTFCRRHEIEVPPRRVKHWTVAYLYPSETPANRRRRRRAAAKNSGATARR